MSNEARAALAAKITPYLRGWMEESGRTEDVIVALGLDIADALLDETVPTCEHDWRPKVSGGSKCSKCDLWIDQRFPEPTPDEIEALALILRGDIGPEKGGLPWAMVADAYRSSARRAIAAGFHRQGPVPDDTEWEYAWEADEAVRATLHPRGPRIMLDDQPDTPERIAAFPKGRRIRRRKAGPWEPVEAAEDAG
jgi:hypothetical protein